MYTISKRTVYIFIAVLALSLLVTVSVLAGSITSSAAPDATSSYTLTDIYNRLNAGTTGVQSTFTEPATGPGSTMNDLNAIMAAAPTVDDANGAGVADVASGNAFWGLTNGSEWGLQTGTGSLATYPAVVSKTGQTTSYATGDDGDLERGVAWPNPRFTDNSDGTVTDNLTGLIWLTNANCAADTRTQDTALTDVASLNNAGTMNGNNCGDTSNGGGHQTDWRLPNMREMKSLIDYGSIDPALPSGHPFTSVEWDYYWSSTNDADYTPAAWQIQLDSGRGSIDDKSTPGYVWPVRAGQ